MDGGGGGDGNDGGGFGDGFGYADPGTVSAPGDFGYADPGTVSAAVDASVVGTPPASEDPADDGLTDSINNTIAEMAAKDAQNAQQAKAFDAMGKFAALTPQDRACIELIRQPGALADVQAGRVPEAIAKCAKTWASLPGAGYNQPERKLTALVASYTQAGGNLEA